MQCTALVQTEMDFCCIEKMLCLVSPTLSQCKVLQHKKMKVSKLSRVVNAPTSSLLERRFVFETLL